MKQTEVDKFVIEFFLHRRREWRMENRKGSGGRVREGKGWKGEKKI